MCQFSCRIWEINIIVNWKAMSVMTKCREKADKHGANRDLCDRRKINVLTSRVDLVYKTGMFVCKTGKSSNLWIPPRIACSWQVVQSRNILRQTNFCDGGCHCTAIRVRSCRRVLRLRMAQRGKNQWQRTFLTRHFAETIERQILSVFNTFFRFIRISLKRTFYIVFD